MALETADVPRRALPKAKLGTLRVPEIGIGTIMWATDNSIQGRERLQDVIDRCMASGLDFFDTAERYGVGEGENMVSTMSRDSQERLLLPRSATIATKFTPLPWRKGAESVVAACEASLERLGTSCIDLYQIHMPDIVQPGRLWGLTNVKDEEYWEGLAECYRRGLVRNVGVSNYGPSLVERCQETLARRGVPLASNQINFSLLYQKKGSLETVQRCRELGVTPLAYYPLAMGLLTGKYTKDSMPKGLKGMGMRKYILGGRDGVPAGGVRPLVRVLEDIAGGLGKTPAQVALNWIICKGAIPLPGATAIRHVDDNVGATGWRLSARQVARLDEASEQLGFEFEGAGFKLVDGKFVGYSIEKWRLD